MIFKQVREGRPYPAHEFSHGDWAKIPPHLVRLDQLVTTRRELGLDKLLARDSTHYGDIFPHAVQWKGELYLEDGLHRCLRAALQRRTAVHVRVLNLDQLKPPDAELPSHADERPAAAGPAGQRLPADPAAADHATADQATADQATADQAVTEPAASSPAAEGRAAGSLEADDADEQQAAGERPGSTARAGGKRLPRDRGRPTASPAPRRP